MKNLKVKSILCNLITILILSVLITSCEQDTASLELKENNKVSLFEDEQITKHKKVIKVGKDNAKNSSSLTLLVQSKNEQLVNQLSAADFNIELILERPIDFKTAKHSNPQDVAIDLEGMERVEIEIVDNANVTSDFKGYNININSNAKKEVLYVITAIGGNRNTAIVYNNSFELVAAGNQYLLCGNEQFTDFAYTQYLDPNTSQTFQIPSYQVENHIVKVFYTTGFISIGFENPGYCGNTCYFETVEEYGPNKTTSKNMSVFAATEMPESINSITGLYLDHKQELLNLYTNNLQVKTTADDYYFTYVQMANDGFSKNPPALSKAEVNSTLKLLEVIEANSSKQLQKSVGILKQEMKAFEGKTLIEGMKALNLTNQ